MALSVFAAAIAAIAALVVWTVALLAQRDAARHHCVLLIKQRDDVAEQRDRVMVSWKESTNSWAASAARTQAEIVALTEKIGIPPNYGEGVHRGAEK